MDKRWYTRRGDDGYTSVIGRGRVPKYHERTEAYGTVDEVTAFLGMARASLQDDGLKELLLAVQRDLHKLMADLATDPDTTNREEWLSPRRLTWLETTTDELGVRLRLPPAFIISGDTVAGAQLDVARTVVRRSERLVARLAHSNALRTETPLKYLNRLSSLLFLMARLADQLEGVTSWTLAEGGGDTISPGG